MLAALSMAFVVGLIAIQEAGAASEMPWAAPPIRVNPFGTAAAEAVPAEAVPAGLALAVGLPGAVGLPDGAADADCVADTAGFTVPGELLHAVAAAPMPIATGTAKNATFICTIAAFPVIANSTWGTFAVRGPVAPKTADQIAAGPTGWVRSQR